MPGQLRLSSGAALQRGFGLLEALVSIVLLASTGVALMAWLQQNLQTASRLQERDAQSRVTLDARRLVDAIDPADKPAGELRAGSLRVRWQSVPEQPARTVMPYVVGDPPRWSVGLYRLHVEAEDRSDATRVAFDVLLTGTTSLLAVPTTRPDTP